MCTGIWVSGESLFSTPQCVRWAFSKLVDRADVFDAFWGDLVVGLDRGWNGYFRDDAHPYHPSASGFQPSHYLSD